MTELYMNEKIQKYKWILEERHTLRKTITRQIHSYRKTQRRLESLVKTAEKRKYAYRLELEVVNDWIKNLLEKIGEKRKENNKKIRIGQGLVDFARLSQFREIIRQNPHIDY